MNTQTADAQTIDLAPQGAEHAAPAVQKASPLAGLKAGGGISAIIPQTMDDAFRLAKLIAIAGWAPKSYLVDSSNASLGYSPEKIAIAIMQGLEVGLTPMAAVQSIAVINGMPSLWGDGALGVVQASGLVEDFCETKLVDDAGHFIGYTCTALRAGRSTKIEHTFTMDDARKANLDKKTGPWQQYPQRMCQMRARAWVLRDGFADVMRGFKVAEEALDMGVVEEVEGAGRVGGVQRRSLTAKATAGSLDAFSGNSSNASVKSKTSAGKLSHTTNARGQQQVNSDKDSGVDRIGAEGGASEQTGSGEDLYGASLSMPEAAVRQFRDNGKWMPAFTWLSKTLPQIADQKVRQEFVDQFRDYFEAAINSGSGKAVEKLLNEQGVSFDARD